MARVSLLLLNVSYDFLKLLYIYGFCEITQGIYFISFDRIFDMARKEYDEDLL